MTPYEKIRTMIYRGQLGSGQRLVERDLAERLGVSRIPLREGMVRLENEGLIRSVPNSSNYVATFGPRELIEIYSMRVWLEPPATRLATIRKEQRLLRTLETWCRRMEAAIEVDDISRVDECDYQFHYAIVAGAGHSRLLRAYRTAHIRVTSFYSDYLSQKESLRVRFVVRARCWGFIAIGGGSIGGVHGVDWCSCRGGSFFRGPRRRRATIGTRITPMIPVIAASFRGLPIR